MGTNGFYHFCRVETRFDGTAFEFVLVLYVGLAIGCADTPRLSAYALRAYGLCARLGACHDTRLRLAGARYLRYAGALTTNAFRVIL